MLIGLQNCGGFHDNEHGSWNCNRFDYWIFNRLVHGECASSYGIDKMSIFEGLFASNGVPLRPSDMQNVMPQYSWEDLRPYTRSSEEEYQCYQNLSQYRMFPESPLDERFADFKVRLAEAIDKRAQFRTNQASS